MNIYIRTTRECNANQLHPGLAQAIQDFFHTHQLGDMDTEIQMCCETIAEKHNAGKIASFLEGNPDTTIHLATLLTTDWLIWARNGDQSGTVVTGVKLKGLQVKVFTMKRTQDMQLEISGFIGEKKEYVRGNLEMGPELAAQKFCEEVDKAVSKVTPPPKKRFFGSIGG